MKIRSYSELRRLETFEDRFDYLRLYGKVGYPTFGFERYLNQKFYTSREWKSVRHEVIARDLGLDLAVDDHEIFDKVIIHHMNPMIPEDLLDFDHDVLNPEFLITTSHNTHNAIHFGDRSLLRQPLVERQLGDTKLW